MNHELFISTIQKRAEKLAQDSEYVARPPTFEAWPDEKLIEYIKESSRYLDKLSHRQLVDMAYETWDDE